MQQKNEFSFQINGIDLSPPIGTPGFLLAFVRFAQSRETSAMNARARLSANSRIRSSGSTQCADYRGDVPVALPSGRAMLATRPSLTGSSLTAKTIGMVAVAAFAANTVAGPPLAAGSGFHPIPPRRPRTDRDLHMLPAS